MLNNYEVLHKTKLEKFQLSVLFKIYFISIYYKINILK